jgi:hypothetical protein
MKTPLTFTCVWTGGTLPKTVERPDGAVETVSYMRNGLAIFRSGRYAVYERVSVTSALFTTVESLEQAVEIVKSRNENT